MTDASTTIDCSTNCTSTDTSQAGCGCGPGATPEMSRMGKYLGGFLGLCVICCAVPAGLIAFGVIGVGVGAYLKAGLEVALATLVVLVLGLFLMRYMKAK